jgi:catechol 2,3-dioxygenase-like lactoylglutathione lyase family enzyme
MTTGPDIVSQHYAFHVSEPEFDEIFARIKARGVPYWADPMHQQPGQINTRLGGRGVYFADPDDHNLELLTYG